MSFYHGSEFPTVWPFHLNFDLSPLSSASGAPSPSAGFLFLRRIEFRNGYLGTEKSRHKRPLRLLFPQKNCFPVCQKSNPSFFTSSAQTPKPSWKSLLSAEMNCGLAGASPGRVASLLTSVLYNCTTSVDTHKIMKSFISGL